MDRPELEERSAAFARQVFAISKIIRDRASGRNPADQLSDAASSAAANYRAAGRARSKKEFVAKLGLVNEEADEAVFWLNFIVDTGLGSGLDLEMLQTESRELRAIFAKSYATAKRNSGGPGPTKKR